MVQAIKTSFPQSPKPHPRHKTAVHPPLSNRWTAVGCLLRCRGLHTQRHLMELKQILCHGRSHVHEGPDTKRPQGRLPSEKLRKNSQGWKNPFQETLYMKKLKETPGLCWKIEPDKKEAGCFKFLLQTLTEEYLPKHFSISKATTKPLKNNALKVEMSKSSVWFDQVTVPEAFASKMYQSANGEGQARLLWD